MTLITLSIIATKIRHLFMLAGVAAVTGNAGKAATATIFYRLGYPADMTATTGDLGMIPRFDREAEFMITNFARLPAKSRMTLLTLRSKAGMIRNSAAGSGNVVGMAGHTGSWRLVKANIAGVGMAFGTGNDRMFAAERKAGFIMLGDKPPRSAKFLLVMARLTRVAKFPLMGILMATGTNGWQCFGHLAFMAALTGLPGMGPSQRKMGLVMIEPGILEGLLVMTRFAAGLIGFKRRAARADQSGYAHCGWRGFHHTRLSRLGRGRRVQRLGLGAGPGKYPLMIVLMATSAPLGTGAITGDPYFPG
jgi:hypothetical protein